MRGQYRVVTRVGNEAVSVDGRLCLSQLRFLLTLLLTDWRGPDVTGEDVSRGFFADGLAQGYESVSGGTGWDLYH